MYSTCKGRCATSVCDTSMCEDNGLLAANHTCTPMTASIKPMTVSDDQQHTMKALSKCGALDLPAGCPSWHVVEQTQGGLCRFVNPGQYNLRCCGWTQDFLQCLMVQQPQSMHHLHLESNRPEDQLLAFPSRYIIRVLQAKEMVWELMIE